ncbi:MAG: GatB/YqeY domain-containing protein [Actinomycetota bacterium]
MSDPSLQEQIRERTNAALKAGDKQLVGTLRLLSAAIKNRQVELGHELSDDEVREVAGREVKKRKESIEAFEAAGRRELADRERAERDVLVGYAPAQLSEDAVDAMIDEAIAATGATSLKEMGKVMGRVMGQARGQVDGDLVQAKVKARLGG